MTFPFLPPNGTTTQIPTRASICPEVIERWRNVTTRDQEDYVKEEGTCGTSTVGQDLFLSSSIRRCISLSKSPAAMPRAVAIFRSISNDGRRAPDSSIPIYVREALTFSESASCV